ncbi:DUF4345 domain-containing protein [Mycobacteroides chelonae]|uniref:DUF4345 domain-containing protein n=1 Tax=Mycobacteroides chelonae TaxID=1774 RepID=UPI000992E783
MANTSTDTNVGNFDNEVRAFKIIAAALTAIPLSVGLHGILAGASALPGERAQFDPSADSEFRFLSAVWFTVGPLVWSLLPDADRRTTQVRILGSGFVLGGLARLYSWRRVGRPPSQLIFATALELFVMPVLMAWQTNMVRRTRTQHCPPSDNIGCDRLSSKRRAP